MIFSENILGNGQDPISEFGEKHQEALNYRFELAEGGDRHQQIFLANMYLEGNGIEQNKEEAEKWAAKAKILKAELDAKLAELEAEEGDDES